MTPSNNDRPDNVVPVQGHDSAGHNGNLVPMDLARAHVPAQANGWHGHTPVVPAAISTKPNAMLLLRALKRRWLLAASLGILVAATAAAATWFLIPINYTVYSDLHMSSRQSIFMGQDSGADFLIYQRTQAAIIRQRFVLTRALRASAVSDLGVVREKPDPIEWLEKALQVDFKESPKIMHVSLIGDRPDELKVLLQAVVDAYLDEAQADELGERTKRLSKLKDISASYDNILQSKRRTYKSLAEDVGTQNTFVLAMKQQMKFDEMRNRQALLKETSNDLFKLRMELATKQEKEKNNTRLRAPDELVDNVIDQDPEILSYETRLKKVEERRQKAIRHFEDGDKDPRAKKYDNEADEIRQAMNTYREAQRAKVADKMRRNAAAVLREKQGKDAERLRLLEEMEKKLREEIDKMASDVKSDARRGVELENLKEQIESTDKISQRLRQMIEEESINITAPTRITRLGNDPAPGVRRTLDEKKQAIIAGGAGAVAMALVFLVVAYWEFLARRIATESDVIHGLGWRLVGAIPDLPSRHRRNPTLDGEAHKHWNSLLTESVDAARALLLRTARTEAIRTVMVTSAVAGEGKTSLSCHLASSLARAGRKTLLIDCDLRRPSVHQLFDMPVEPGFSGVLRGDVDLSEVIRPTPAKNLWVVPAGQCDAHTLEALAQEALASVLARVKEQFDFILIDSSPVLPVADALIIGQHVDGVLFSLLRDVSRFPNVYAAYERLSSLGIRMLGAVVNGVRQDRYGYSYQYYYNKDHN